MSCSVAPTAEKIITDEWLRTLRDLLPEKERNQLLKTYDFDNNTALKNSTIDRLATSIAEMKMGLG